MFRNWTCARHSHSIRFPPLTLCCLCRRQEAQGGYAVQVQEQETDEALRLPSRQGREPVLSKVQEEEADAAAASADAAGAKAAPKDEEVMDVEGDNS